MNGASNRTKAARHIPADGGAEAGVVVETAGQAVIRDDVRLVGTVMLNADRHAHVEARFPGTVRGCARAPGRQSPPRPDPAGDRGQRKHARIRRSRRPSMASCSRAAPMSVTSPAAIRSSRSPTCRKSGWSCTRMGSAAARVAVGQKVRISSATSDLAADTHHQRPAAAGHARPDRDRPRPRA